MGRQTSTTLPDNGVVTNEWFDTGEQKKTYGARTYTEERTYDYAGRVKTLLAGTGTTTWNYSSTRGFPTTKRYNDNKGPDYTNTSAGRLLTRVWARGITTTYSHNNAGELSGISYSDSTPAVTYTYDRRGRKTACASSADTVSYTYNDAGEMLTESHSAGPLANISVISGYDSVLRRNSLSTQLSGSPLSAASYTYDNASRLASVSDGTDSAEYAYLANSSLITNIVFKHSGSTKMTTTRSYDNLNRLTSISSVSLSNQVISSHSYQYNMANQRTQATLNDGSYWQYGYDSLGQVTNAVKKWSDSIPVAGEQFRYAYDSIGNRTSAASGGDSSGNNLRSSTYTANTLNQYTQRIVPGGFDVIGTAQSGATVTVNNQSVYRKGEYYRKELSGTNTSTAVYANISIVGVKNNVGTNGEDAVTTVTGSEFVPKTAETFSYDDDGNLTGDGRWKYSWDGENRLITMETDTNKVGTASVPRKKLDFSYDNGSRRVEKKVYNWSSGSWSLTTDFRFAYDGWNLIAILDSQSSLLQSFLWGKDLSGSLQGAGGVGGLLRITDNASTNNAHFAAYDGNGNLMKLVKASDGTVSAEYEYGPFGNAIRATGTAAADNPIRFSSKYEDVETELLYFGYRYLGERWLSRDPIEEQGGLNLYSYVGNNPVNRVDPSGLACAEEVILGQPVVIGAYYGPYTCNGINYGTVWSDVADSFCPGGGSKLKGALGYIDTDCYEGLMQFYKRYEWKQVEDQSCKSCCRWKYRKTCSAAVRFFTAYPPIGQVKDKSWLPKGYPTTPQPPPKSPVNPDYPNMPGRPPFAGEPGYDSTGKTVEKWRWQISKHIKLTESEWQSGDCVK